MVKFESFDVTARIDRAALCRLAFVYAERRKPQADPGRIDWAPPRARPGNEQMSRASGSKGDAMSEGCERFWSTLPKKVLHPVRVPIVEALWWIGEPLSAIALVDVLDGFASRNDLFDVPYQLKDRNPGEGT
jgi:hypothetical protein